MARPTLTTHPKFAHLAYLVGGRAVARGSLELIWEACYAAGNPDVGSAIAMEALADWRGTPGTLADALVKSGFVDARADGRYLVHDLEDHAPDYVLKRWAREEERRKTGETIRGARQKAAAQRWINWRETAEQTAANGGHQPDTVRTLSADVSPPAPAPAPNTDQRGEVVVGETDPARRRQEAPSPPAAVLTFPIVGRGPKTWDLTRTHVAEWSEAFPTLDVVAECRAALAWAKATPAKRKTARGMPAFLVSWLGRSQNSGRGRGAPTRAKTDGNVETVRDWHARQEVKSG